MTSRSAARAVFFVGPAVVWTLAMFGVGAIPVGPSPPGSLTDKWLHAIAFGLYVPWLLLADIHLRPSPRGARRIAEAAATSSVVGMLLEIWQLPWPTRSFELLDWVADTAGAMLVGAVALAVHAAYTRLVVPRTETAQPGP